MIKLIAVDVDGTLLGKGHKVAPETIEALNHAREQGIKICIATGRHPGSILPIAKEIGTLDNDEFSIGLNGGIAFKYKKDLSPEYLYEKTFTNKELEFIFENARKLKVNIFAYTTDLHKAYVTTKRGIFMWWMKKHTQKSLEIFKQGESLLGAFKTITYGKSKNMIEFRKIMQKKQFETFAWSYVSNSKMNIELNPKGVDKVFGLQEVCKQYGIKQSEVMYFGDGENDMKSLEWANMGIAMGNAKDHVKAKANFTTEHHKQHGVAVAIEEMLKNNK